MAFWSKKKIIDGIIKYLNENNITWKEELGFITYELFFNESGYSLYPYIQINEEVEEISILINIKEIADGKNYDYSSLNDLNVKSKYFTAKIKDKVLILEYNCNVSYENVSKFLKKIVDSIFSLQKDIDNL